MDDTSEMSWFYAVVKKVLDRRPFEQRTSVHDQFMEVMEAHGPTNVFCSSFSEVLDSRSQWLEYADEGHGFSVGFDPSTFALERPGPVRPVELQSVIYDEEEQDRLAQDVVRDLKECDNDNANTFSVFAAHYNTWRIAAKCKNPAFRNEREWRLIFQDDPGDAVRFRERAERHLVPFIEFPIDPAKNPIRKIWLGPRNQSQRNVDALGQLLKHNGFNVSQIRFPRSEVPLRPEY